jgi:hypothetical protein
MPILPDVMVRSRFGSTLMRKFDPSKRSAMLICRDHVSFGYLCCDTRMEGRDTRKSRPHFNPAMRLLDTDSWLRNCKCY